MWPSPTLRLQSLLLQNLCWPKVFHQTQANMLLSPKALLWPRPKENRTISFHMFMICLLLFKTQDHEVLHPNTSNQIARPHALLYSLAAARRQPVNKNSCKDKKVHLHSRPSQAHYQWYDRHFSTLSNWVLFPVCRAVDQQVHHDSRYPPEFKRRWFSVSPW